VAAKVTGGQRVGKVLASIGNKLAARQVRVGFLESAKYPPTRERGTTPNRHTVPNTVDSVAQVAFWNEFGTSRAPARPFFRTMIAQNSPGWGKLTAVALKATNYDETAVLGAVGEAIAGELRVSITTGGWLPNSAYTIRMKNGAAQPLVDSGVMLGSVAYEVKGP
jgi:hypothetical protein